MKLPEGLLANADFHWPAWFCSVRYYPSDIPADLRPIHVIPASLRAGRAPADGERNGKGREPIPILCRDDAWVLRGDLWHSGQPEPYRRPSVLCAASSLGTPHGRAKISPYRTWRVSPDIIAQANRRMKRKEPLMRLFSFGANDRRRGLCIPPHDTDHHAENFQLALRPDHRVGWVLGK